MVREGITSDLPMIRTLMQMVPGFWQPWWSDNTIAVAIRCKQIGVCLGRQL